ncbi:carbon-nitrogen hydrolase family protein, partial [Enterobacter hormaechei]|nr:carbon-nitrogen hydrolase family protein [Enterobacter hormaechei]
RAACKRLSVFAQVGFNERSRASIGCLYNSTVLIGDDGALLNHHRKLVPTFYEKLTWAPGDGAGLRVVDTNIGR